MQITTTQRTHEQTLANLETYLKNMQLHNAITDKAMARKAKQNWFFKLLTR